MKDGTSLTVQRLGLHASSAGNLGSIPGQGTRSHMLQRRSHNPQLRPGQSNKEIPWGGGGGRQVGVTAFSRGNEGEKSLCGASRLPPQETFTEHSWEAGDGTSNPKSEQ